MDGLSFYDETCFASSKLITQKYSTSFTKGIRAFDKNLRDPIYSIYGFVRTADEIVDTFHGFDQQQLLLKFSEDTFEAIKMGISTNPVLQSFQLVVNRYKIELDLIKSFLNSMQMDIVGKTFTRREYDSYIYGSAEVVGLMCLKVFCDLDTDLYNRLKPTACKLGAAFQKINFLRDINADFKERGRVYFPEVTFDNFNHEQKKAIEQEIAEDFDQALEGIKMLPKSCRLGVYLAFSYFKKLLNKISALPPHAIRQKRVRVSAAEKFALYISALIGQKKFAI
ncbi:phytoene/squalene synthase family protein [Mucilaginibacter ginkgonis]|uniref:Phytoene/squalene synthase family protein n=1 Tax=Mucilaginibacter ginkgonis TaxID=2682091 RepID=A0A6I4IMQ8_9SPHI|nr:phytoene/squalene synthase family protein [Mucilaginibacter ginkgonis]QQL49869.1 phytoene/squalene synthase family protein [Mucilaginibacter ginkgonis]